jgi:DnaJ-class molecular chaperone
MASPRSPYDVLGVKSEASPDEIRRAYRKLAKLHHPDLNPGKKDSEDRFKEINAANNLLSDPDKRKRFDSGDIDAAGDDIHRPYYRDYADSAQGPRYGAKGPGTGGQNPEHGWSHEDLSDIFGTMFGQNHAGTGPKSGPRRGPDARVALTLDFLTAINGGTIELHREDGSRFSARIPPGVADRQILRLRGQGYDGFDGGAKGDALAEIHVTPHPFFTRDGQNIRMELPITIQEAVLGGPVDIPTPAGTVRMKIPPGSDSGTELRLRGRGVAGRGGAPAGDFLARLKLVLGIKDAASDEALAEFFRNHQPAEKINPRADLEIGA